MTALAFILGMLLGGTVGFLAAAVVGAEREE